MAIDYMDQWDVNGELYDIHDKGRGQPNGVATLNSNGLIPTNQLALSKNLLSVVLSPILCREWTRTVVATITHIKRIGNLCLVAKQSQGLWWSEDGGLTLTLCEGIDPTYNVAVIECINGLYLCWAGADGPFWSEDGKTWAQGTIASSIIAHYIVNLGGIYFAYASSGNAYFAYSLNGKDWTRVTAFTNVTVRGILYENNLWMVYTSSGIYKSSNGTTWQRVTMSGNPGVTHGLIFNHLFVFAASSRGMWWYDSANNVMVQTTVDTYTTNGLQCNDNTVVRGCSASHGMWTSTDGKTWTVVPDDLASATINSLDYFKGMFICTVNSSNEWYSYNGTSWIQSDNNTLTGSPTFKHLNGLCIAGLQKASIDGLFWFPILSGANIRDISSSPEGLVLGSNSGLYISTVEQLVQKGYVDFGGAPLL